MREVFSVNEREVEKETFLKVRKKSIEKERNFSDFDYFYHDTKGNYCHSRSIQFFTKDSESLEDFLK